LSRLLAAQGIPSLRFDLSGIGDSPTRTDKVPFEESSVQETRDAMDYLAETRGCDRFLLAGICTGAVASYHTALADPRVLGALMINAQGLLDLSDEETRAYLANRKARRYYVGSAIYNYRSWLRLISGRADYRELFRVLRSKLIRPRTESLGRAPRAVKVQKGLRALADRGTKLFFLFSEGDPGIDELNIVLGDEREAFCAQRDVTMRIVENADHMFTALSKQQEFLRFTGDWLQSFGARVATQMSEAH
jgi:pimeloyl-ACP methyl ester carboxylesterase